MRVAGDRPLCFRPAQHGRGPLRPAFRGRPLRSRIRLIAEIEQTDMPQGGRTESTDLDVVLNDGERLGQGVRTGFKEPALIVVARTPGQDATDVESLALNLEKHILWSHALCRVGVV